VKNKSEPLLKTGICSDRQGLQRRNFAFGEYLLALRLASKLADLRAANTNPYSNALRLSVFDVSTGHQRI
jgi:hypothetical protein